jgi:hypothetical protein
MSTVEVMMANEPKRQEPEIMPPRPDVQPERTPTEIPQDKDAPEKDAPVRADASLSARYVKGDIWWC